MKRLFNIKNKRPIKICNNCNHDHIAETGDDNKKGICHYELLDYCCYCNCEKYKMKRTLLEVDEVKI